MNTSRGSADAVHDFRCSRTTFFVAWSGVRRAVGENAWSWATDTAASRAIGASSTSAKLLGRNPVSIVLQPTCSDTRGLMPRALGAADKTGHRGAAAGP